MKFRLFKTPRFFRWIFPSKTWGFSLKKNTIYLTFDDGPNPNLTPWILDLLKEKNIKATFFCVGTNVLKYPEIFNRIKQEGHEVGNHTMRHENGIKTDFKSYLNSVEECKIITGSNLFRPPYGRMTHAQTREIRKSNKIIMWSWLSYDFDEELSISKIISRGKKQIKSGDIIVIHDNDKFEKRVKELLTEIIKDIKGKGFEYSIIPK